MGDWLIQGIDLFTRPVLEEDKVDRLNYYLTSWILRALAATVMMKEWAGSPIQCWTDHEVTEGWDEYLQSYCFVESTYYVPIDDPHHKHPEAAREVKIQYYQWVFVVLFLQSICFILPHMFWHSLNWIGGIPVEAVLAMAKQTSASSSIAASEIFALIASFLHQAIHINDTLAQHHTAHTPTRLVYTIPQS